MRLVLAGTPDFATEVFRHILHSHHEVLALIAQPDKPFGRTGELKAPSTKNLLLEYKGADSKFANCEILQPSALDEGFIAQVRALKPEAILVVAYGRILPRGFLDIAPCVNIHASLLPKWRGASPLQQMILEQGEYYGVSAMRIEEGLDSGAILGLSFVKNYGQDLPTLALELAHKGGALSLKILSDLESARPRLAPLKQIQADASYCVKVKKSDGAVDFRNALSLWRAYLAYCAWPHIYIHSAQGYTLKLFEVELVESTQTHRAGEILKVDSESVVVGCEKGSVRIGALQQEGKARLKAPIYLNGKRLHKGDILS